MKSALVRGMVGALCVMALPLSAVRAEEEMKALPTLLIKGELVSVDANDPSAVLLKVKDRYGFETPIYLSQQTKMTQGDAAVAASSLSAGASVEVEYNFDINTAKRHAVSVKVAAAVPAAAPAAAVPAVPATGTVVEQPAVTPPAAVQPAAPAAPAAPAPTESAPAKQ